MTTHPAREVPNQVVHHVLEEASFLILLTVLDAAVSANMLARAQILAIIPRNFDTLNSPLDTSRWMQACQHADMRWTTGSASFTTTNAIFHLAIPIFFPFNGFTVAWMAGTIWQVLCS
jgi:hypothetical protein